MNTKLLVTAVSLLLLLLASCASPQLQPTLTPAPTPEPKCQGQVCIRQAFVSLDTKNNSVLVEFDLVDKNGKVEVGAAPRFDGQITAGLFKVDGDVYLYGAKLKSGSYVCYAGNDIPWSKGILASSCGFSVPSNQMQVKPNVGDLLRVKVIEFDFSQTVKLVEKK